MSIFEQRQVCPKVLIKDDPKRVDRTDIVIELFVIAIREIVHVKNLFFLVQERSWRRTPIEFFILSKLYRVGTLIGLYNNNGWPGAAAQNGINRCLNPSVGAL